MLPLPQLHWSTGVLPPAHQMVSWGEEPSIFSLEVNATSICKVEVGFHPASCFNIDLSVSSST